MQGARVYILTGERESGKSTFLEEFIHLFRDAGYCCSGIVTPSLINADGTKGYRWLHIPSKRTEILAISDEEEGWIPQGDYYFSPKSFEMGTSMLQCSDSCLVVLDEIGKLELKGEGWSSALNYLLKRPIILVLCVRKNAIEGLKERWDFIPLATYDISETTPREIVNEIIKIGPPAKIK